MGDGERIWSRYIGAEDEAVIRKAGYGQRMDWGRRPALLVVDATYDFCGDESVPVAQAIDVWPNGCGENAWRAVSAMERLVRAARDRGVPVIYTIAGFRADAWDLGSWRWKTSRTDEYSREGRPAARPERRGNDVVAPIAPAGRDIVIQKLKPSAFHGTPLRALLTLLDVDTLVVTGGTTSGCVRATVLDAFSENIRVVVPEEACFDRVVVSHAINLFDMNAKYADVVGVDAAVDYIAATPEGLFRLPDGV